jgi:serine/threonine protein kinase
MSGEPACSHFAANIFKKDICSNCQKGKASHQPTALLPEKSLQRGLESKATNSLAASSTSSSENATKPATTGNRASASEPNVSRGLEKPTIKNAGEGACTEFVPNQFKSNLCKNCHLPNAHHKGAMKDTSAKATFGTRPQGAMEENPLSSPFSKRANEVIATRRPAQVSASKVAPGIPAPKSFNPALAGLTPSYFSSNATISGEESPTYKDDPVEAFLERIRNKVYSLNLFQDHAKYRGRPGQSIAREVSSLLEVEVSALGDLVGKFWRSAEGDVISGKRQSFLSLSPAVKDKYVRPSSGQLMSVGQVLGYVQRSMGIAEEDRIVPLRSVCESLDRLGMEVAALSNIPQGVNVPKGLSSSSAEGLAARDQRRDTMVREWTRIKTMIHRMKGGENGDASCLQVMTDGMRALESTMALHQKITEFPREHPKGCEPTHLLPYQLADRFVEDFNQSVIFPAVQARMEWKHLVEKLQLAAKHRASVSPADEAAVAVAEGKSIEASIRLRQQYNDWIPLLRFGFPELRGKISSLVDEHCGMGSLRMDISADDFEWTEIAPSSGGATVFRAVTKASARKSKALDAEYCIKRFANADDFYRELEAMRVATNSDGTHHPNVVEMGFAFEEGAGDHRFCFIAMPLYPMTSPEWFATHGSSLSNMKDTVRVLTEIVSGLACLHSRGILHGDLKPDNIMMDGTGVGARPKLIDFNFSTVRTAGATNALRVMTAPIGVTNNFAPPEFLDPSFPAHQERTPEFDVYSLGRTFEVLLKDLLEGVQSNPEWSGQLAIRWLQQLVKAMTDPFPENRPLLGNSSKTSEIPVATLTDRLISLKKIIGIKVDPASNSIASADYLTALSGNIRFSFEWYGLGLVMNADETVNVCGVSKTQRLCYVEALKHDPTDSTVWNELGVCIKATEQVEVSGTSYREQQCYVESLKHNRKFSPAWNNLGFGMNATEQVQVNGTPFTKRQCYVEALKLDPRLSVTWYNLGSTLIATEQVQVNGQSYTQQQCYSEAEKHDPIFLGNRKDVTDNVQFKNTWHHCKCFAEALKSNPKCSSTWNNLGACMDATEEVQVNGARYTKRQCYTEALKHAPKYSPAWNNLGFGMNATEQVQVNGTRYTKRQCYVEALKLDPKYSAAWNNLGYSMNAAEQVQVNGASYTRRQCYVEALKHDPMDRFVWNNLGNDMNATENVQINVKSYTKRQCYVEALKHGPSDGYTWFNLGNCMNAIEQVQVSGRAYAQQQCFLEALKLGPTDNGAWTRLGKWRGFD